MKRDLVLVDCIRRKTYLSFYSFPYPQAAYPGQRPGQEKKKCLPRKHLLYSDCLRRESNFLASMHRVTALLHCMLVRLRNGYTQAYAQIMQHTHMHTAVTGHVEAKKLLSRRRQSNYSFMQKATQCITVPPEISAGFKEKGPVSNLRWRPLSGILS